ncbi:MAG: betaine/proline/choline family ABC transporter ATP-binding protein [Pseudomonadota bacterium]|nr:betaine/proline/choline family ABC transporter ATP-binding protein [Pseudomonadota bacterium]
MRHDRIDDGAAAIECRNLYKVFGSRTVEALAALRSQHLGKAEVRERYDCVVGVDDVSFSVKRGEVFCIMGLSGSGKSTLVRHINRLVDPTAGSVLIDGEEIGSKPVQEIRRIRSQKIGMVFQNFALMPHLNVLDNVAFGLELRSVPRQDRQKIARDMLARVQLQDWADAWLDQLSGGMQQRVGLARALAGDPDILLLDEPFGALDPIIRRQLQDLFLQLSRSVRKTTVFITHDLEEAMRLGDRVAIMRDGRLVQIGTASEIVTGPRDDYVRDFVKGISRLNILTAGDILEPLEQEPAAGATWPSVTSDATLGRLIELAVDTDQPILVRDEHGRAIGMVRRRGLFRAIQGQQR